MKNLSTCLLNILVCIYFILGVLDMATLFSLAITVGVFGSQV